MADNEKDPKIDESMEDGNETSTSDSENDSPESDSEERLENNLLIIEQKLQRAPYVYDLHVEKVQLLRNSGEFKRLREARESMNKIFPLSEELWMGWIQDEIKVSEGSSSRKHVTELFDRAVSDYMSVAVWLEYVQYAIGAMGEPDGIRRIRDVFERAITSAGLHVTKGAMIWDAYREFENAILMGLQPGPGAVTTADQQNQLAAQTSRITSLFRRQLAVPLQDMKGTYDEYKEWITEEGDAHIDQIYHRMLEKLKKLQKFEDELLDSEPPHLNVYLQYIEYEVSQGEPARIQCIYERAIQENCLIADLWTKYTKYLITRLKIKDVTLRVYERSVRNCPWCADLWLGYVRAMERHGMDHHSIIDLMERTLSAGFDKPSDYLRVWTGYCDYLRRRINWEEDHETALDQLRATLDRAITLLEQNFGRDGDPDCMLLQYYARMEAMHCRNMPKCRELWSQILQKGLSTQCAFWVEYLNLERSFGDSKHCRKILQRALNSVTDFPESICDTSINYEREEGTLEQYDQTAAKCEAQLQRIEERRAKVAEKEALLNEQHKKQQGSKKAAKKTEKRQAKFAKQSHKPDSNRQFEKAIPNSGNLQGHCTAEECPMLTSTEQHTPEPLQALQQLADGSLPGLGQKRKHGDSSPVKTDADGFKVPAPPGFKSKVPKLDSTAASQAPPGFKPTSVPQTSPKVPPGYKGKCQSPVIPTHDADTKVADKEFLNQCLEDVKEDTEDQESMDTSEEPLKDSVNEKCTVFVSNLAYDVDEVKLKHIFSKVGDVKEVRLVRNVKAKSRGFAYIQFVDEFPLKEALAMDRNQVDGRPMFVSPCEQKGNRSQKFKYSTGLEKNKLFVSGLPFTVTKEALETIFSQHGKLKSVRIVTYRSGASKGLAFVEYEDQSDATQAILKADGLQVGDHTISVAISNPPERKTPMSQRETSTFVPTLGSGKRETTNRGKARTQLPLIPRSLKKGPTPGNKSEHTARTEKNVKSSDSDSSSNDNVSSVSKTGKKSNADFRDMLLSK